MLQTMVFGWVVFHVKHSRSASGMICGEAEVLADGGVILFHEHPDGHDSGEDPGNEQYRCADSQKPDELLLPADHFLRLRGPEFPGGGTAGRVAFWNHYRGAGLDGIIRHLCQTVRAEDIVIRGILSAFDAVHPLIPPEVIII